MADETVSMDAQVNINQLRVLTRDDELRLFALQTATKDTFRLEKMTPKEVLDRQLTDAKAFYNFLSNKEDSTNA